jgi:radical SAM superfamily enzyme YgiQ (UPF0313 family)
MSRATPAWQLLDAMPKLLLITASSDEIRSARRSRFLNFQQITIPYLAARVTSDWSAYHAYGLAARFRSRGTCVVMGGPHVTVLPEEAARHADVIFVGEAEGVWEEFLNGVATGSYRRVYRQTGPVSLGWSPRGAQNALSPERLHKRRSVCHSPNRSDFCSIIVIYQHRFRKLPIAEVAAEYGSFDGKRIIFWDDNIDADKEYAKQLFRAVAPYRKWWRSQTTIHAA